MDAAQGGPWDATFTIGKMENPFAFSDLVFDPDYTPEGVAARLSYPINFAHTLRLNAGAFALDEISGSADDPFLLGAQLRWETAWNKRWKSIAGVAFLVITADSELSNAAVPNINTGNARGPGGLLADSFNPVVGNLEVTRSFDSFPGYSGHFPISARGDVLHNPAADDRNTGFAAGVTFGKSGKKSAWELSYNYRYVEADAWFEEFLDSDKGAFYGAALPNSVIGPGFGAGTNLKGHTIRAGYSPYDAITLGVSYYLHELISNPAPGSDSGLSRVQVDATWKF